VIGEKLGGSSAGEGLLRGIEYLDSSASDTAIGEIKMASDLNDQSGLGHLYTVAAHPINRVAAVARQTHRRVTWAKTCLLVLLVSTANAQVADARQLREVASGR